MYPKKSQLQNLSTQKNPYFFSIPKKSYTSSKLCLQMLHVLLISADEKYSTQKSPCVFFTTQENPSIFHRPKKFSFGKNVRIKKILRITLSLKYVSGAPGPVDFVETVMNKICMYRHFYVHRSDCVCTCVCVCVCGGGGY